MKETLPLDATLGLIGQRVTSAAPSLSPSRRYLIDRQNFSNYKHDRIIDEGFARYRATNVLDGGRPMTELEAQIGRAMKSDDIQKRLLSLNSRLVFIIPPADENKYGVYLADRTAPMGIRFLCGMERGWTPEFTVRKLKWEKRLVKSYPPQYEMIPDYAGEKRGWRKVLAVLIRERVITKAGAEKVFGLPSMTSQQWKELTA